MKLNLLKSLVIVSSALTATLAAAHPSGVYKIDGNEEATVAFEIVKRCAQIDGAMRGSLRTLTFSEAAMAAPYEFITGYFVEAHTDNGEDYVNVDEDCFPKNPSYKIPATRSTFAGFSLERMR